MQLAQRGSATPMSSSPIPDSGVPATIGFARSGRVPVRARHHPQSLRGPPSSLARTALASANSASARSTRATPSVVRGKRVVLIDDSVVRGTTSKKIVQLSCTEAGAKEDACASRRRPSRIRTITASIRPSKTALLAANFDLAGMREFMGADSLAFLSVDGIYRAVGLEQRDAHNPQFTDHCFTGEYPTELTDQNGQASSRQLSLLAEVG